MSATILTVIVLIVMWVVVLVPLLVRRAEDAEDAEENVTYWAPALTGPIADDTEYADATARTAEGDDPYRAGRPRPAGDWYDSVNGDQARRGETLAADRPARRGVSASTGRGVTMVRRRRVLGMLAALVVATAAVALLSTATVWLANALCDALLLGYLGKLRADARHAAAHRRPARRPRTEHVRPVAAAPARRPSRPIALDDEDPCFAQLEVRYPRAANE